MDSQKDEMSRREFLLLTRNAILASGIPAPDDPTNSILASSIFSSEKPLQQQRFFENIDSFSIEKSLPEIRQDLIAVPEIFVTELESFEFNPGPESFKFDKDIWQKSIEEPLKTLARIKIAYDKLPDNPNAQTLLAKRFYEVGSGIWAVLRIKELYGNDKSGFINALSNPSFDPNDPKDSFLGEEIYTINANWVNIWSANNKIDRESFIYDVLRTSGRSFSWILRTNLLANDRSTLNNLEPDPANPKRPKPMEILLEKADTDLKTDIQKLLRQHRLDRIGSLLLVSKGQSDFMFGVYSQGSRSIEISIDPNPSHQNYLLYPNFYRSFILHESGGHGVKNLIPYQSDDATIASHFGKIDKVLEPFRPYRSLEAYFKPKGVFQLKNTDYSIDKVEIGRRDLNEATVTEYGARQYGGINHVIEDLLKKLLILTSRPSVPIDNELPVFRFLPQEKTDQTKSDKSYWDELGKSLEKNRHKITPFERDIFIAVMNHIDLYDAPERSVPQELREDRYLYAKEFVIPAVIAQLVWDDKGRLESLMANMFPDKKGQQRARHLFRTTKRQIGGQRNYADNELFADVVQFALRRHDPGIVNSLPEENWEEVETLFNNIVTSLIDNGLAKLPPTNLPIA